MKSGRKPTLSPQQIQEILNLHNQEIPFAEIKKQLNLKIPIGKIKSSIRYHIKKRQVPQPSNIDNPRKTNEIKSEPINEKKN